MTRDGLEAYIFQTYGIAADYPFTGDFVTAVFRHPENRKWFAIAMRIPKAKLGIAEDGTMAFLLGISFDRTRGNKKKIGKTLVIPVKS